MKRKDYDGIKTVVTSLVIIAAVSILLIVIIAPEAMLVLAGKEYHEGVWVIPPLAFSVFLIFIYTLLSNFELFYSKNYYVLISSVVGASVNILLNYLLLPMFGFVAAGYTTLFGYLVMCICHMMFISLTCRKEKLDIKNLFNFKIVFSVTIILAGACALLMLLYNTLYARYIVLLITILIVVLNRKKILALIKRLKTKDQ